MKIFRDCHNVMENDASENQEDVADGVGLLLRQTREGKGFDLSHVSEELRIGKHYLLAMEEGRYGVLPGQAYASGFVRAYAEFLGLDSVEIVRRFKRECDGFVKPTELIFHEPMNESNVPGFKILLAALLLGGLGYGVWHYVRSDAFSPGNLANRLTRMADSSPSGNEKTPLGADSESASGVVEHPDESGQKTASPSAGEGSPTDSRIQPSADPSASPQDGLRTAPPKPAAGAGEDRSTAIETVHSSDNVGAAGSDSLVAGDASSRVRLYADQDCWIEIRNQQDAVIHSRLLHKGETYLVPDHRGLILTAGSAGALTISVDGKTLPPLGRIGMVRRALSLDPDSLASSLATGE